MSSLAISDSFEYLCYGSKAIRNIFTLTVQDRHWSTECDVYRRQILSTKVDPRVVRVKGKHCDDPD